MGGVLVNTWPLLTGILLLMVGNGIQGTLLGIRGAQEGFSTIEISVVMSAYFVGFLGGSRLAPHLIKLVGHVRVFAALGSLISATLILYAQFPVAEIWIGLRVIIGFCFSGVYVVAESWLNDTASNETRGKTLSLYVLVQLIGIVTAQVLLNVGETEGFLLFVLASVLVSVSFTPILLTVGRVPAYETAKPMTTWKLVRLAPLGAFGTVCLGAVFAAQWGMIAFYGVEIGLSVGEISILVGVLYAGGIAFQFPLGWLSDRVDRRLLIMLMAGFGVLASLAAALGYMNLYVLLGAAFVCGGMTNPLYSILIAHTNDFIEHTDMASAAGRLVFLNGAGAIGGPLLVGWLMEYLGPNGFWAYIGTVMAILTAFSIFRMMVKPLPSSHDTLAFTPIAPNLSPVAHEVASEYAIEQSDSDAGQLRE